MKNGRLIINGHFRKQQVTGVQRYALEILREFDRMGLDYSYLDPPDGLSSDIARQLWMQGIMPFKIPKDKLLWSPTNIGPAWCENQVITLHDIADQLHPRWFSKKYVAWRACILPELLKRVRGIITVSEYSRQTILERYPFAAGKIEVIYNGVRTEHFYPRGENEVMEIKKKFNLQKSYVVTVGSLDPRKNINNLITAWNRLPPRFRDKADLVIAGGSAEKFSFQIEEETDESVRFLGYVDNEYLPALYSGARFFIYPSLFEGFGLPVLEAMACGTPVITSNTTSLKELANGHAITVHPEKPEHLSSAMKQLIDSEDLCNNYVEKGYHYAQSFTWADTAKKTRRFLEEHSIR